MTHPTMTWKVKCCTIHLEYTHWNVALGAALEGITSCCFYSFFSLFCEMLDAQSAPVIWFMPDKSRIHTTDIKVERISQSTIICLPDMVHHLSVLIAY